MTDIQRLTALCLAALLLAASASAAEPVGPRKSQIYVTGGGAWLGDALDDDVDSFTTGTFGLGYQVTEQFATEVTFGLGNADLDIGPFTDDVDVFFGRLDGIYDFGGDGWRPYTVGGIGGIDFDSDNFGSDTDLQFNTGAGLMRPLTDRLRVRGDVRAFFSADEDDVAPGITFGLQYVVFGSVSHPDSDGDGVSDPTDQCPGTAPGTSVDMHGCPVDSDGDGVPDVDDRCPGTSRGVAVDRAGCALDRDADGVPDHRDACPDTRRGAKVDARGCARREGAAAQPSEAPPEAELPRMEVIVHFDLDSSRLRRPDLRELDRVVDFMESQPSAEAEIEGFTDSTGASEYNQALSERRARAVRDYLLDQGISARRVRITGYGETRPVADNESEGGRQANRRVAVTVVGADRQR